MKNFKLKRLLGLTLIGGLATLNASTVFAAAGDTISNTATLNYNVASVAQTAITSAAADFVEDRKIIFTVAESGGATTSVSPNGILQVQTFTITNNGNATQDFLLTALNRTTGTADPHGGANDIFDATSVQVRVDSALTTVLPTTDVFDGIATDSAIFIDNLAAGTSRTVYIVSTIPGTVTNAQVAVMSLVAQVAEGAGTGVAADAIMLDDNNHVSPAGTFSNGTQTTAAVAGATNVNGALTVETVFADVAGTLNSAGAADSASNGQHSDDDSYTVSSAALTVTKAVVPLWDPINGNTSPKSIPGAYMQYTITVANAGPAAAVLTTLSDALQAAVGSLALDPNLILATATTPVPGAVVGVDIESAIGSGIRINTAAGVGAGTSRLSAGLTYCTGDIGDADTDGCAYTGGAGGTLSITFSDAALASIAGMLAEAGPPAYAEGELLSGESVDIVFNAIVQ
ncbi:MAG: hypothetical protein OEY66_04920 [Gammaproteobacteria bacterium]|nr:hypothetical protein [Gammaproteobacteria bacterium]